MSQYDGEAAFREKQDAKFGGRGGYEGSLHETVDEKMAAAEQKAVAAAGERVAQAAGRGCPRCGEGTLIRGNRAWGCGRWQAGCSFRLPFESGAGVLSEADAVALLEGGRVGGMTLAQLSSGLEETSSGLEGGSVGGVPLAQVSREAAEAEVPGSGAVRGRRGTARERLAARKAERLAAQAASPPAEPDGGGEAREAAPVPEAAAKLAAFETKLRGWVAEKMAQYDGDAELRRKQDAKYGGRAGYEASLEKTLQGKMAGARARAASPPPSPSRPSLPASASTDAAAARRAEEEEGAAAAAAAASAAARAVEEVETAHLQAEAGEAAEAARVAAEEEAARLQAEEEAAARVGEGELADRMAAELAATFSLAQKEAEAERLRVRGGHNRSFFLAPFSFIRRIPIGTEYGSAR
jgi:hypothetical protein